MLLMLAPGTAGAATQTREDPVRRAGRRERARPTCAPSPGTSATSGDADGEPRREHGAGHRRARPDRRRTATGSPTARSPPRATRTASRSTWRCANLERARRARRLPVARRQAAVPRRPWSHDGRRRPRDVHVHVRSRRSCPARSFRWIVFGQAPPDGAAAGPWDAMPDAASPAAANPGDRRCDAREGRPERGLPPASFFCRTRRRSRRPRRRPGPAPRARPRPR